MDIINFVFGSDSAPGEVDFMEENILNSWVVN